MNALSSVVANTPEDTSHFCRALDHFRRTTGSRQFFHELQPDQRSVVLKLSQQFKMGLDVCEGCDQWGYHDEVNSIECSRLGTIFDLNSERILCERHFEVQQRESVLSNDCVGEKQC